MTNPAPIPNAAAATQAVTIGNAVFARSKAALVDTLFHPVNGRTANGYCVKRKGGVAFHKPDGEIFAFLVCNRHGERFFVSVGTNGAEQTVYMHSTSSADEARLGLAGLRYLAQHDEASRVASLLGF